jgi:hypothetical protein
MKLFHYNKMRRKTHLWMEIGTRPATFLDVPDKLYDEFIERYALSGIHNKSSDEPKYIMEIVDPLVNKFKTFFDIDNIGDTPLTDEEILKIVHILQKHITSSVYVTGCISDEQNFKVKTGLHLKCPDWVVTSAEMMELHKKFVHDLYIEMPDKNWASIIDDSVYVGSRGIRMFGSRKVTKGVDQGHVYKLLFTVGKEGNKYNCILDDMTLLKTLSILT